MNRHAKSELIAVFILPSIWYRINWATLDARRQKQHNEKRLMVPLKLERPRNITMEACGLPGSRLTINIRYALSYKIAIKTVCNIASPQGFHKRLRKLVRKSTLTKEV